MDNPKMKRNFLIIFRIAALTAVMMNYGCGNNETGTGEVCPITREVLYESPAGEELVLLPGNSHTVKFNLPEKKHPVGQTIRVTGYSVLPEPFTKRGEDVFRNFAFHIDDYLDSTVSHKEQYSLVFMGNGEKLERNAFYRLSKDELRSVAGKKVNIDVPVLTRQLVVPDDGYLKMELQIYQVKPGRHPDDIYDEPDEVVEFSMPADKADWYVFSGETELPENIACILFRIGSKNISGKCHFGTPSLRNAGTTLRLLPFRPYQKEEKNWIGENLSTKEWPEFELSVNGNIFFTGKLFDRASQVSDFEVDLPEALSGDITLGIKLKDGFPARYPYTVKTIELLESGARDFEVMALPEFIRTNQEFALLVSINRPGTRLDIRTSKNITASVEERLFDETGLHTLTFTAGDPAQDQYITLSDGKRKAKFPINQIIAKNDDRIYLSTGDDIYIDKTFSRFSDYIVWYLREGIGNAFCWRPSEQWSDAKVADPGFYKRSLEILNDLHMPYSLMIEGRTITGRNINPEEDWMKGPNYLGRQAHENDGGYYYWTHFKWEWLHSDLSARYRPRGGIFAKNRPVRTDKGIFVFYDPYKLENMEEGPEYFIENLRNAKGESTRHTGPSTLFRYLFQAGYDWVGAEQMYGPEEVIMSSVRGASRAYGKNDFGTHLATQWGSGPVDAPEHATRLFLSLAISYIHGATHINTEDGLWNTEPGIDRYSRAGQEHIRAQRDIYRFISTHERRGTLFTPMAVLQGRNDAWKCFGRNNAWSQRDQEWNFGPAEESFDLLNVFYPGSKLEPIYKYPCPKAPQGWYTSTPYGLIDLLPLEAPGEVLEKYRAIAFLGWNTYSDDDFNRLTSFVKKGNTLLLTGAHLNTELKHDKPVAYPGDRPVLRELLGDNYEKATQPVENRLGEGRVIFFPVKKYPVDASIRHQYEDTLREIMTKTIAGENRKGWIENSPNIEFAAWDWNDGNHRTIYLLNIDWWSDTVAHQAALMLGNQRYQVDIRRNFLEMITVCQGVAIMPMSMTTDILDMKIQDGRVTLTVQTTGKDQLTIFSGNQPETKTLEITKPGIHNLEVFLSAEDQPDR
jgi:hypothetical protein